MTATVTSGEPRRIDHPSSHPWPTTTDEAAAIAGCRSCGLRTLRLFIESAKWVTRRVETIEFIDDRTVRRRVSVSYVVPEDAMILQRAPDVPPVRLLPIAALRRKSLINFHFKDHDDRPIPLLGLRENQTVTLALINSWAHLALQACHRGSQCLASELTPDSAAYGVIQNIVEGDQDELNLAWSLFHGLPPESEEDVRRRQRLSEADRVSLEHLREDDCFKLVLERLAHDWLLFAPDEAVPGTSRVVKFSYDEPLTARYSNAGYRPHERPDGSIGPPRYRAGELRRWREDLSAGLGLRPALVRFPVPGAELASSYHLELSAPPGALIVGASLLAGLPNLYGDPSDADPAADRKYYKQGYEEGRIDPRRRRRRPSYDIVGPGYPTIDLHVADVPYGSLSRAQVLLRGRPQGWLAASAACSWVALLALWGTSRSRLDGGVAATLLITLAAGIVTLVVREDEHRMVTRLLGLLKLIAATSVGLLVVAAVAAATVDNWYRVVAVCGWVSTVPALLTTVSWGVSMYSLRDLGGRDFDLRLLRWLQQRGAAPLPAEGEPRERGEVGQRPMQRLAGAARGALNRQMFTRESPWEQYPLRSESDEDPRDRSADERHEQQRSFAAELEVTDFPYDDAVKKLGFDRPAIRVASAEGSRMTFRWNRRNRRTFMRRLRGSEDGRQ